MINLSTLTFDQFTRSDRDTVCLLPVRTIIRLEEEITVVKKIKKFEEIDASPACPAHTNQYSTIEQSGELKVYANWEEMNNLPTITNTWGKTVTLKFKAEGTWAYGENTEFATRVDGNGNTEMTAKEASENDMRYASVPPSALVALKNGKFETFGKEQTVTLEPGDTLSFINNDQPGIYYDNGDDYLTIKWSVIRVH